MARNTFKRWLARQAHRRDHVGDLAGDARHDSDFPTASSLDPYRDHLTDLGACAGAHDALECAWLEYQEAIPPRELTKTDRDALDLLHRPLDRGGDG